MLQIAKASLIHSKGGFIQRALIRCFSLTTHTSQSPLIVSSEWLSDNFSNVKIIDASWYPPVQQRNANEEFIKERIPSACRFNIGAVKCASSPYLKVPSVDLFETTVGGMGISEKDHVVFYDTNGWSAQRSWWTFKVFGHKKASILEGGLLKWKMENRPLENGPFTNPRQPCSYQAAMQRDMIRSMEQMKSNISTKQSQVLDARPRDKFIAPVPDNRPGLRGGHIPGSLNLPSDDLLEVKADGAYKVYLPDEQLINKFKQAGLSLDKPITTTCATGVTAAVLYFALYKTNPNMALSLYDGAWSEWVAHTESPIEN